MKNSNLTKSILAVLVMLTATLSVQPGRCGDSRLTFSIQIKL